MEYRCCKCFSQAVKREHIDCIDILIRTTNVNEANRKDKTALHYAAKFSPKCLDVLISHKADVNRKNIKNLTPLHIASMYGNDACVLSLIQAGANVNSIGEGGWSPLHLATWNTNSSCVRILLENGASVRAETIWKWTPLHYACYTFDLECIKLLLVYGADINVLDEEGKSPLTITNSGTRRFVREFLYSSSNTKECN